MSKNAVSYSSPSSTVNSESVNTAPQARTLVLPVLRGKAYRLHPVHQAPAAADPRPATQARWDAATGTLHVPARTALVYVVD